jgi:hypothetical protein
MVVLDAGPTRPPGEHVPDGLVQAAGDQPPLRQPQLPDRREEAHEVGIGADDALEARSLLLGCLHTGA